MPLQWRDQFWQSLEEGAGKWCSECGVSLHPAGDLEVGRGEGGEIWGGEGKG